MLSKYKTLFEGVESHVADEILNTLFLYGSDKLVFEKRLSEVLEKRVSNPFAASTLAQMCEDLRKHLNNGKIKN